MTDKKNNTTIHIISICKIIVYGIITQSILNFGIYYTITIGSKQLIKEILKDVMIETIDKSISKNLKEIFSTTKKK